MFWRVEMLVGRCWVAVLKKWKWNCLEACDGGERSGGEMMREFCASRLRQELCGSPLSSGSKVFLRLP